MHRLIILTTLLFLSFNSHSQIDTAHYNSIQESYHQNWIQTNIPDSSVITKGLHHLEGFKKMMGQLSRPKDISDTINSGVYKCKYKIVSHYSRQYRMDDMEPLWILMDSVYTSDSTLITVPTYKVHSGSVEISKGSLKIAKDKMIPSNLGNTMDVEPDSHSNDFSVSFSNDDFAIAHLVERREGGATYWVTESYWCFEKN
jgi:hypothetical protein